MDVCGSLVLSIPLTFILAIIIVVVVVQNAVLTV